MRVVVRKIDGVSDVRVSLKEGMATIRFAPSNRVRIEQVWDAVRSNGFTPRAADVRVRGVVSHRGDTLLLTASGSEQRFALQGDPGSGSALSALRELPRAEPVVVEGQVLVPERARPGAPLTLLVRQALIEEAPR